MNNTELSSPRIPPKLLWWRNHFRSYILELNHSFDISHKIDHVDRVLANAITIQNKEGGDLSVIIPAVFLHDCVPIDKRSHLRAQASELSAIKAGKL